MVGIVKVINKLLYNIVYLFKYFAFASCTHFKQSNSQNDIRSIFYVNKVQLFL